MHEGQIIYQNSYFKFGNINNEKSGMQANADNNYEVEFVKQIKMSNTLSLN